MHNEHGSCLGLRWLIVLDPLRCKYPVQSRSQRVCPASVVENALACCLS